MDIKKCSKCKEEKKTSEFTKNIKKKCGYNSYCKDCNKIYQKKHYNENKEYYYDKKKEFVKLLKEFIDSVKMESKCSRCEEDDIACLDFHHISNNKDFNIAESLQRGFAIQKIKEEIDKCIILCSNCHRKLHYYNF